eukprot:TRINITY_DN22846_c0_g1_i1.p1 TRINITY_DN22846_c0_g1~~TRINITY_DN22846_c0_g1_i1.p1  ORF type:complete len:837 (+),score=167.75 TRINITY_DN22846_c0_g1_i1:92-2602(+)
MPDGSPRWRHRRRMLSLLLAAVAAAEFSKQLASLLPGPDTPPKAAATTAFRGEGLLLSEEDGSVIAPVFEDPDWLSQTKLPLLAALVFFASASVFGFVALAVLQSMQTMLERWSPHMQDSFQALLFINTLGSFMYFWFFSAEAQLVVSLTDGSSCLLLRNIYWLVSTPLEWYIFAQSFTSCEVRQVLTICVTAALIQAFGIGAFLLRSPTLSSLCFCAGSLCFCFTFLFVYRLKLLPETMVLGQNLRSLFFALWCFYPLAILLRRFGLINPWMEQVMIYSLLDVVMKSVLMLALTAGRVVRAIAGMNGTMQLALSSYDLVLAVDEDFRLTTSLKSVALLAYYYDDDSDDRDLLKLCINEEHANRLRTAAEVADNQAFGAAFPKCIVVFKAHKGRGELQAECLVSKVNQGRRTLGISLSPVSTRTNFGIGGGGSGGEVPGGGQWDHDDQRSEVITVHSFAETTSVLPLGANAVGEDLNATGESNMQMMRALQNCTDIMGLSPRISSSVRRVFQQNVGIAALYFFEETKVPSDINMVAASQRCLRRFPELVMPARLSQILDESATRHLAGTIVQEDLCVYQRSNITMKSGDVATVTALPLNRFACMVLPQKVQLGILLIEFQPEPEYSSWEARQFQRHEAAQHHFWYFVGSQLMRLTCGVESTVYVPVDIVVPPTVARPAVWTVCFSLPIVNPDDDDDDAAAGGGSGCREGDGSWNSISSSSFGSEDGRGGFSRVNRNNIGDPMRRWLVAAPRPDLNRPNDLLAEEEQPVIPVEAHISERILQTAGRPSTENNVHPPALLHHLAYIWTTPAAQMQEPEVGSFMESGTSVTSRCTTPRL